MARQDKQNRGSAEPLPGKCGGKLAGSNPPRYCTLSPARGGNGRCARLHNGRALSGPALPQYIDGRSIKTQFDSVLPPRLRQFIDPRRIREITDCSEQLLLIDARTAEVLEDIRNANPSGYVDNAQIAINLLRLCVESGNKEGAALTLARLETLLSQQRMVAQGWEALDKLFDRRGKLSTVQQGHISLVNKTVLVGNISDFMMAMIGEVRRLTDDPQKISMFARRVRALAGGLLAQPDSNILDAEVVTTEEEPEVEP